MYGIHLYIFLGICQTANLDGETNLKIRKALERTWDYLTPEKAAEFKGDDVNYVFMHIFILLTMAFPFDNHGYIS